MFILMEAIDYLKEQEFIILGQLLFLYNKLLLFHTPQTRITSFQI